MQPLSKFNAVAQQQGGKLERKLSSTGGDASRWTIVSVDSTFAAMEGFDMVPAADEADVLMHMTGLSIARVRSHHADDRRQL